MSDVYTDLANHLNRLPAGFPPTDSGVELRILKRLFTEEEAGIAQALTMIPEPASGIAQRLDMDEAALASMLEAMSKKGLIFRSSKNGSVFYMAAQFVVGIWEYHLNSLDEGLIRDVNEYLPQFMRTSWTSHETKQMRVIPVSVKVTAEMTPMDYDVAEELISAQSKIVVCDCICRKENRMIGKGCDAPMEVCLAFGGGAYYNEENGLGRSIDTDEALEILKKGRKAGLVLQPGNSKKPMNICMCCGCCCQVLKNLKTLDQPALAVHSNYLATVDNEACVGCEDCIDRCHLDAIEMDEAAMVIPGRCIGCGVCVSNCPSQAIILEKKQETGVYEPPENVFETYLAMAKERGLV